MNRMQKRTSESRGALYTPKGEVKRLSAKLAGEAAPSSVPVSAPAIEDGSRQWLLEQLSAMGAENPSVNWDKRGYWNCRDGRRKLGAVDGSKAAERSERHVAGLFDLRAAVTLTIARESAPTDLLWALSKVMPHVQREVVRGLLRGDNGDDNPASWSYRRGVQAVREWQEWRASTKVVEHKARAMFDASLAINSGLMASATKRAADRYGAWKSKQADASPPWAHSLGFDVSAQCVSLEAVGKRVFARIAALGMKDGHRQPQPVIRVIPHGGSAWSTVRKILSGEHKSTSARVVRDEAGHWLLKLSYTMPRPDRASGVGALVVRRGMGSFLVSMGNDGRLPKPLDAGHSLVKIKRQMHARRNEARKHLEHQGKGARGHGRKRFWRLYETLESREARFVDAWCKQQAAHIVGEARRMGYSEVILEDFVGSAPPRHPDRFFEKLLRRFPFAQLRQSVEWVGTKRGVPTRVVGHDYDGNVCPECGENGDVESDKNGRADWFTCASQGCGYQANSDTVAIRHIIHAAKVEDKTADRARGERRVREAVKQAAQNKPRGRRGR